MHFLCDINKKNYYSNIISTYQENNHLISTQLTEGYKAKNCDTAHYLSQKKSPKFI